MSDTIENAEELFRFASARAPGPASLPEGILELADDSSVAQWLASPPHDFAAELQGLEARAQAIAQGAPDELLTALWKLYLQGISSGQADSAQLLRIQTLMGQASAPGQPAARTPAVRLPAAFEQAMRARRQQQRSGAGQGRARLRDRLSMLGKLEREIAAAIDSAGPAQVAPPAALPHAARDTDSDPSFHLQPAADVSAHFIGDNAGLMAALDAAQIPSAGVSPYHLLDEVRRQMAELTLAESRLAASAPPVHAQGSVAHFGVRPVGVADLRCVKQVLVRYEKGELAHIDNVIEGEKRERHHSRLQRAEQGATDYSDRSTEQWRESQSAERFELGQWAYTSSRENQDSNSSISFAATYGEITVSGSTFINSGRGRDAQRAEDMRRSREMIDRALTLTRQSVGQYRWRNVLSDVQETIIHKQHAKCHSHIKAQYRWVDKVYRAQVYNYGARAMYEIMVPSPAAMFKYLLAQQPGVSPFAGPPPVRPAVRPADITDASWAAIAAQYGVNLPAPPLAAITEFAQVNSPALNLPAGAPLDLLRTPQGGSFERTRALDLGYQASSAGVSISWYGASGEGGVTASIGTLLFTSTVEGDTAIPPQALNADTDSVPYSASAWGSVEQFTVNFYIVWTRTQRALEQWQLASYQIIQEAYARKLAAWRAQVADTVLTTEQMRAIERAELKRAIIEIVRAGGGQGAPAPAVTAAGRPVIQVAQLEAAAREVRFVEYAFEWDQMTYRFLPYAWSAESGWSAQNFVAQGDSVFTAFLNAGFASVILPVRKGYENAAAVYLQTGMVFDIAVVPADDDVLRMNCEVIQINSQNDGGVPEGEPWTYRVPTSLIVLEDGTNGPLPQFLPQP